MEDKYKDLDPTTVARNALFDVLIHGVAGADRIKAATALLQTQHNRVDIEPQLEVQQSRWTDVSLSDLARFVLKLTLILVPVVLGVHFLYFMLLFFLESLLLGGY